MTVRNLIAIVLGAALFVAACGGDEPRELAGYRREPPPPVGELAMPDLTADGAAFHLRADEGKLLAVYFGYTHCPDFCPTTLSDLKLARNRLDDPEMVDVAMITVDPDRDLPILAGYITSFFESGHALGTDDPGLLAQVGAPFGAAWEVTQNDEGEVEVAHTTQLYAVNDAGEIELTWQFGTTIDDLHADLELLLEEASA